MNLTFRKADAADLELLVKNRIEVLRAANGFSGDTDMSLVEQESRDYYRHAFEHGGHVALLVYDGDSFAGCGGVSFYRVMPTYHNPTGRCAYIMNMYTRPGYRRRGIASLMLECLMKEIRSRGITKVTLEATDAGRPLYEKYGFISMKDEMEYPQ